MLLVEEDFTLTMMNVSVGILSVMLSDTNSDKALLLDANMRVNTSK